MGYAKYETAFCWFLTFVGLSYGSLNFATDLPTTIRYNVTESVVLTAIGATIDQTIKIKLQITSAEDDSNEYFNSEISHQFSRNFHTFHIPFKIWPSLDKCRTNEIEKEDFMCSAHIKIKVTEFYFPLWSETVKVEVVKTPGKIHIETDRPIYFPGDLVFVRFIPLNEDLFLLRVKALWKIESPAVGEDGVAVWEKPVTFKKQPFVRKIPIPEHGPLGEWRITATYTSDTVTDRIFQSGFEVTYFTLPSFKVSLEYTKNNFILPNDEHVPMLVSASTLHDKPIKGNLHMRFGIKSTQGDEYDTYTHAVTNEQLNSGKAELNVPVSALLGVRSFSLVAGLKLIVISSVTEYGSGETVTIRDESALFTSQGYVIEFVKERQFFYPGVPAIINIKVYYANGSIAAGVKTTFKMTYHDNVGKKIGSHTEFKTTCQLGTAMIRARSSTESRSIKIEVNARYVSAGNNQVYITKEDTTLNAQGTSSSEYIYIQSPPERLQVDTTAPIQVYVKASSRQKIIHYNIMKKDKLLYEQTETVGIYDSDVLINLQITATMSPSVTMTAYYFSSDLATIVEDRAVLFIEDVCTGERPRVSVEGSSNLSNRPGDQVDLQVTGEPSSIISMIATGEASKLFSTDEREEYDDLDDVMSSRDESMDFCKHNRKYVGTLSQSRIFNCDEQGTKRRKRSLVDQSIPQPLKQYAYKFTGAMFDCCIVGARDISDIYLTKKASCKERERFVQSKGSCKETFMECCKLAECLRNNNVNMTICTKSLDDLEEATPLERTISDALYYPSETLKAQSKATKSAAIIRNNFDLTWFFVDFRMDTNGRKYLRKRTAPGVPRLPDRITTWNIDIISSSVEHPLCVGKVLKLPVEYNVYIDVKINEEPITIGTHVHAEVTVYNYMNEDIEVEIHIQGDKGFCGINTEESFKPALKKQRLESARGKEPSTFGASFVMVPLKNGDLKIKFRLEGYVVGVASTKILDQVEKVLKVIPEETLKGKVIWDFVVFKHRGFAVSRDRKTKKKLPLDLPDAAVPGTEEVSVSVFSVPSAALLDDLETTATPTTIQHILYKLVPAVEKFIFMLKTSNITSETEDPLLDKIQEAHSGLLGYVKPMENRLPVSGGGATKLFGFSHSPAANSIPSMLLTSSVIEPLYRTTPEVKFDQNLLRGSLYWVLSHQTRQGYFRTTITENAKRKRDAANPSDRLFLSKLDRKVYITSKILLDLVSIKLSLERNSASESSDLAKIRNAMQKGRLFVRRKIAKVARQSKCSSTLALSAAIHAMYRNGISVKSTIFNSLMKWKRSSLQNTQDFTKTKWLHVCPYNPSNKGIDPDDIEANKIEGTAHLLNIVIMRGYYGDAYAKWLLQSRNFEGRWKSLRAAVAAMKAFGVFVNTQKHNTSESVKIELNDPEYKNLTLASDSKNMVSKVTLKNARPEISYSAYGQGRTWIKVEESYRVASPTQLAPVKVRAKTKDKPRPNCIYDLSISLSDTVPLAGRSSSPRSERSSWDVTITVEINELYPDEEYQSYVIEFNLPFGSKLLGNYREKLFNSVEHVVDHCRVTSKSVLLYMTGSQTIQFGITESFTSDAPIPAKIYPVTAPEKSCTIYYNYPSHSPQIATFCSTIAASPDGMCACMHGKTCPDFINRAKKTIKEPVPKRINRSCERESTFAYKVNFVKKTKIDENWHQYDGTIETIIRNGSGTMKTNLESKTHAFWIKFSCTAIPTGRDYLVIGNTVSVNGKGTHKHLLDSNSWVERWPSDPGNCKRRVSQQCEAYSKLDEYAYEMTRQRNCANF